MTDSKPSRAKRVVLLVDHRQRDLPVASLIAFQLRALGVDCFLEPIDAYRGALAAHKPNMIIYNHLLASHLVSYTKRLAEMGVKTGVILNEGLCYDPDIRAHNAQKNHRGAHLDFFFCWNQLLKEDLQHTGLQQTRIEVVGNPRHDFLFSPWSEAYRDYPKPQNGKPMILICTNFGFADFHELPRSEADKFFAPWKDRIRAYQDYMGVISAHHRYRENVVPFLNAVVDSGKFNVVLRPHPRESIGFYEKWMKQLTPEQRSCLTFDSTSSITSLLLACDLAIGCENCNTTLEAWIARKPSLELIFDKHPVFYNEDVGKLSPHCDRPQDLVSRIEENLRPGAQEAYAEGRVRHLAKWCNDPSGQATERIAAHIATALAKAPEPDWRRLTLSDYRRAAKLRLMNVFDQPYQFKPLTQLKAKLSRRHRIKWKALQKSIRPSDVRRTREQLESYYNKPTGAQ